MAYTETTRTGYGRRLGNSLKNIIVGLVLLVAGTFTLFWNEGNYVKTKKALNEAAAEVVALVDINTINPEFEGKFIHASGFASPQDSIYDNMLGVRELAIGLSRKVEYYQWVEHSETETVQNMGGSEETITTYHYKKEWSSSPINSLDFHDPEYRNENFVLAELPDKEILNTNVHFGAYKLPEFILQLIQNSTPAKINLSKEQNEILEKEAEKVRLSAKKRVRKSIEPSDNDEEQEKPKMTHVNDNVLYIGKSFNKPGVGDVRVTVEKTEPTVISLLASVKGNSFEMYKASNGRTVVEVAKGEVSAQQMFEAAHADNEEMTWGLRMLGAILIITAIRTMFGFVSMLFKVVPFLGNIVEKGVYVVAGVVGIAWSLIVIATAWLFYRPVIAILLILIIIGIFVLLKRRKSKEPPLKQV